MFQIITKLIIHKTGNHIRTAAVSLFGHLIVNVIDETNVGPCPA